MKDQRKHAELPKLPEKEPSQCCNASVEVSDRYPEHPALP